MCGLYGGPAVVHPQLS